MRKNIPLVSLLLLASPALADDRAVITGHMQEMADAVATGHPEVWDKYLDPKLIYADEEGNDLDKPAILKQLTPLPKRLSGSIKTQLLSYNEDRDVAVALIRQNETEQYYGQTIHDSFLTNTTWRKGAGGWKMIAAQVLAEKTDPPTIALPAADLAKFAGTYRLRNSEPTFSLVVTNGKLVGTRSGRKPAEWKAETRDVFFLPGDNRIRKIFQYDSHGNVTGFVERRESWDIYWDKQ